METDDHDKSRTDTDNVRDQSQAAIAANGDGQAHPG